MKYQNDRGGSVVLDEVPKPNAEWGSVEDAMQAAMELERGMNHGLILLHKIAAKHNDADVSRESPSPSNSCDSNCLFLPPRFSLSYCLPALAPSLYQLSCQSTASVV